MSKSNEPKNSKNEIRKLVLAKKLFLHGCDHSFQKDAISRMIAIHNFDNAIEMVLDCVVTKFNLVLNGKSDKKSKKYWGFHDYLNAIKSSNKVKLPLENQIKELRDIRNGVQHRGDIPDIAMVIKYKGYTEDFLKEIIMDAFSIPYEELSLSTLIENRKLKEKVLKAEKAFEKKEYKDCILVVADEVLSSATFEESDVFGIAGELSGMWGAGDEYKRIISGDYIDKFKDTDSDKINDFVNDTSKAILQLGQLSTAMQFLDEYRVDFIKFWRMVRMVEEIPQDELKENAQFSLSFATNLILKWQEEGVLGVLGKA